MCMEMTYSSLCSRGYKEDEIEEAFKKFDTDGNRVLDADEQAQMLKALEDEKVGHCCCL